MNLNDVTNTLNTSRLAYQAQQQSQQTAGVRVTTAPAQQPAAETKPTVADQTPAQTNAPAETGQIQTSIRQIQMQQTAATSPTLQAANKFAAKTQQAETATATSALQPVQQTQQAIPVAYQTGAAQESQNPLVNLLG